VDVPHPVVVRPAADPEGLPLVADQAVGRAVVLEVGPAAGLEEAPAAASAEVRHAAAGVDRRRR